jgi:hypothetical protein
MSELTKPSAALESQLRGVTGLSDYYLQRVFCNDGTKSKFVDEQRAKGKEIPDVGQICLKILEHSADIEANPAAKAARPDKELLGPFKAYLIDKGFNFSEAGGENVLKLYTEVGKQPNVRAQTFTSLPVQGKPGKEWVFTPGSALDAAFSDTVRRAIRGEAVPQPTTTAAALAPVVEACFKDASFQISNKITMGSCTDAGNQLGAIYAANKGLGRAK